MGLKSNRLKNSWRQAMDTFDYFYFVTDQFNKILLRLVSHVILIINSFV